ncbi:AraC family transcriptional regulator [Gephyromycinifex aptenodytis]|uniref:AraC family transcriptional regulator n=1 Tax=Gephyromycinifex aptenodytis TaxID=2716227 RepID=UPI0014450BD0|nr:AraC family transcriptional regulator [Gephyromycinifex aptenodytis]
MDPLSQLLNDGHNDRHEVVNARFTAPWALTGGAGARLVAVVVAAGQAWCHVPGSNPVALTKGDLVLLHRTSYAIGNDPRPPTRMAECAALSVTGSSLQGPTRIIAGQYSTFPENGAALSADLPSCIYLSAASWEPQLLPMLVNEASQITLAQRSVLRRLLDLVLVEALREWCESSPARGQAWLRAAWDPIIGPVLSLMHDDVAHPWTIHELAEQVGCTRVSVASRFHALVGQPPLTYLAQWRLNVAAELLENTDKTVTAIAREVGFTDPFRFSAAFVRRYGCSPARYRLGGSSTSAQA